MKPVLVPALMAVLVVGAFGCGGGGKKSASAVFEPPDGGGDPLDQGGGNGNPDKVALCHKPEDGAAQHSIEIDDAALDHHLAHGDTVGECVEDPLPEAPADKTTLCHVPPGNGANAHTITVSNAAVPHHEAHGDALGGCPEN